MAVFALNNGRLEDAPRYVGDSQRISSQLLRAISSQTLALINRQLFPVGNVTNEHSGEPHQSLIALDSAKRVVTIEVINTLDSEALSQAIQRSGKFSTLNRQQLLHIYPGTEQDFAHHWSLFVEGTAPMSTTAPRIYIFCLHIDHDAREALSALDVEVKLIVPHQGNDSTLVEVTDIDAYAPFLLSAPQAPWMIGSGDVSQPTPYHSELDAGLDTNPGNGNTPVAQMEEPTTELVDQSLWDIKGWVEHPEIPHLPSHAASPRRSRHDISVTGYDKRAQLTMFDDDEPAVSDAQPASAEPSSQRQDSAIKLAQLTEPPRRRSRRAKLAHEAAPQTSSGALTPKQSGLLDETGETTQTASLRPDSDAVLYQQLLDRAKRAEQRLWDKSAPKHSVDPIIFSEEQSASEAERAVAQAAAHDQIQLAEWIKQQRLAGLDPQTSNHTQQHLRRSRRARKDQ